VRKGKWKAIRKNVDDYPDSTIELYDLSIDISEQNDVSADFSEVVEEMVRIMDEAHSPSEYFPFPNLEGF